MAAVQAALPESGLSSPCNLQQVKQHSTRYTGSFAGAISEIVISEIVISEIVGVVAPTRQPTGSWQHAQTSVSARGGAMPATARTRARAAPIGRACGHRALRGRCCLSPRPGRPSPPITPRPACHVCVRLYGGSSTCMLMRTHTRTHARTRAHASRHMHTYKRTQTRLQAHRHTQDNVATIVLRMRVPR